MATREISEAGGKWSETTAWAGGVVPKVEDDVIALANGKSGSLEVAAAAECRSIDFTNYSKTFTLNSTLKVGTSTSNSGLCFRCVAGMTFTHTSGELTFVSTSGTTEKVTCASKIFKKTIFNGAGGVWQLQDKLNVENPNALEVKAGTLETNGQPVATGSFSASSGATVKLGASSISCTGTAGFSVPSGATFEQSGSTITLNTNKSTFEGGGHTYGTVTLEFEHTIAGSNTLTTLNLNAVKPIKFTEGTTQTVTTLATNAKAGAFAKLESTVVAKRWKITSTSKQTLNFIEIKDGEAEGTGSPFNAGASSLNRGNNAGWLFPSEETLWATQFQQIPPTEFTPLSRNLALLDPWPPFTVFTKPLVQSVLAAAIEPKATLTKVFGVTARLAAKLELKAALTKVFITALAAKIEPKAVLTKAFGVTAKLTATLEVKAVLTKVFGVTTTLAAKVEPKAVLTKAFGVTTTLKAKLEPKAALTKAFTLAKTLKARFFRGLNRGYTVLDSFQRANETSLSGGKWVAGKRWTSGKGRIIEEAWAPTESKFEGALWNVNNGDSSGVSVELHVLSTTSGNIVEILLNGNSEGREFHTLEVTRESTGKYRFELTEVEVSEGQTSIKNEVTVNAGDFIRIIESYPGKISGWLKKGSGGVWEEQVSYTSKKAVEGGYFGIGGFGESWRVRNFAEEPSTVTSLAKAFTVTAALKALIEPKAVLTKAFGVTATLAAKVEPKAKLSSALVLALKVAVLESKAVLTKAFLIPRALTAKVEPNAILTKAFGVTTTLVAKLESKATLVKSLLVTSTLKASMTASAVLTKVLSVTSRLKATLEPKAVLTKAFSVIRTFEAKVEPKAILTKVIAFAFVLKASLEPKAVLAKVFGVTVKLAAEMKAIANLVVEFFGAAKIVKLVASMKPNVIRLVKAFTVTNTLTAKLEPKATLAKAFAIAKALAAKIEPKAAISKISETKLVAKFEPTAILTKVFALRFTLVAKLAPTSMLGRFIAKALSASIKPTSAFNKVPVIFLQASVTGKAIITKAFTITHQLAAIVAIKAEFVAQRSAPVLKAVLSFAGTVGLFPFSSAKAKVRTLLIQNVFGIDQLVLEPSTNILETEEEEFFKFIVFDPQPETTHDLETLPTLKFHEQTNRFIKALQAE